MKIHLKVWISIAVSMVITSLALGISQITTFNSLRDRIITSQTEEIYQSVLGIANDMDLGLRPLIDGFRESARLTKSVQIPNWGMGDRFVWLSAKLRPLEGQVRPAWFQVIENDPKFRSAADKAMIGHQQRFTYFPRTSGDDKFPDLIIFWLFPGIDRAFGELVPTDQVRTRIEFLKQEHNRSFQTLIVSNVLAIICIVIIQGIGSVLLIRKFLIQPLRILQNTMEGLAAGNAELRWNLRGKDEIHQLGLVFNSMADRLTSYSQRLEKVIAERNIELEQVSRRVAWGSQMAAEVAHDIKSPLGSSLMAISVIQGSRAELNQKFDNDTMTKSDFVEFSESTKDLLNIAESALNKAVSLSNGFKKIVLDQIDQGFKSVIIAEYLDDVVLCMRPLLKRGKVNTRIICPSGLHMETDPGAISQIFTNLIQNSLTHGFSESDRANKEITIRVSEPQDGLVTFEYTDNGDGMSPEVQARIFEPMFTTNRELGGSGLGMGIIKNLVDSRFGGSISVTSSPGRGSAFTIILPLSPRVPDNDSPAS